MAAPYHNLLSKNDRALAAYLISKGVADSTIVVAAKRSLDKTAPLVACFSESAVEQAIYSGTYKIVASVNVKTIGVQDAGEGSDAARLASDQLVAKTFDCLHLDIDSSGENLANDITLAARALSASAPAGNADLADYTCLDISLKGIEAGVEGDAWVDTLKLEMVCCPANVS
jgi:hypothetical protein